MKDSWKKLLRSFAIELVIYGGLVVIYFLVALKFLGEPLASLFERNLTLYGFIALSLIVGQGVLLEAVTSLIIERFGLDRME